MLERLASAVVPGTRWGGSPHAEPRYRSALDMRLGAMARNAARGGVLRDGTSAQVRIFLDPWVERRLS